MKLKICFPGILLPNGKVSSYNDNSLKNKEPNVNNSHKHVSDGEWNTGILIALLFGLILNSVTCQAQEISIAKGLKIGEHVPNITVENIVNYPTKSLRLTDLRDKLVIIDFWATWCGACIEAFPHMQQLQDEFKDKIQIFLMNSKSTGDSETKILNYFNQRSRRTGQTFKLPYVSRDTVFTSLFPHRYVPHYAWILNQKVIAITSAQDVNSNHIRELLADTSSHLHYKKDIINFDPKKPFFLSLGQRIPENLISSTIISHYIEGTGRRNGKILTESGKLNRLYFLNMSVMGLYREAFSKFLNRPNNQIIIEDNLKEIFNERDVDYSNLFCYELITPPISTDSALLTMQHDLRKTFNADVVLVKRKTSVWLLKTKGKILCKTKGGVSGWEIDRNSLEKYIRNLPVSSLVDVLNSISSKPIVNDSCLEYRIDIELPTNIYNYNVDEINRFLNSYGFEIVQSEREMIVALIK